MVLSTQRLRVSAIPIDIDDFNELSGEWNLINLDKALE